MTFRGWEKVTINNTAEGLVEGIAPVIISASRSTDIPAFYSGWFIKRLRAGYTKWTNPFNRRNQYVSFKNTRAIIFWTKNARPMLPHLPEINQRDINYYFTFTLNDYEEEGLEPNVPKIGERIETFKELSSLIGKEKVIWRFDPLILSDKLTVPVLLDRISKVGKQIHPYTKKLVISFADISIYAKVKRNLKSGGFSDYREFDQDGIMEIAAGLEEINRSWGLEIATCAEEVDLSKFGIKKNKCVDDALIIKLFNHDQKLMDFLGYGQSHQDLFGATSSERETTGNLKDKGQRKPCGCIVSKDIGQYNTCMHLCVYCYANYSKKLVEKNYKRSRDGNFESILCD